MAAEEYQEYSSKHCKYQVFLSFRGDDTRKNFTDHLHKALVQAGIHTFRDNDEIQRGENIDFEIQKAIQQSRMSIVVFSKDYASSRWCLDEIVMIMEHRRNAGCIVLPVFYDVDPSQVGMQTGSYATAFAEHEKWLKEEIERVNGWRIALKEVADLAGMVLGDRHEAQFVQSIVENVSKKLDRKIFHVPHHFIGRDYLIDNINSWLQDGSHGAAIAILYGIGGAGKTTLAKSVYNQNFDKFEGRSFLANVRERSNESNGLVSLQRQLLSDILNKTASEIHDVDEGIMKIKDAICCRRTLIVLDDVDKGDQFNAIIGMQNWLYRGSKIILTTRRKGLIAVRDGGVLFKVEALDKKRSLELFSWHAFGKRHPDEDFVEYSNRIVSHCNGLPLALRAIGSSLFGKRTKIWESALQEMEAIPNCEVQKVLRVSYDSLDDDYQKNLFLDIACFFNEMDEDYVIRVLDGLGIGAAFRIENLIDRCLVEISLGKKLRMHQLVRDMGREIARKDSPKCQRIWQYKEAFTVLKETALDTGRLRGLTLDMHELIKDNTMKVVHSGDALENSMVHHQHNFFEQSRFSMFLSQQWLSNIFSAGHSPTGQTNLFPLLSTDSFRKMENVKFLKLNFVKFGGSYEHFPKNLLWLCWHGFALRSIPKHFCLEKLVVLDLSRSSLVDVWKGKMSLPKLKIFDLRYSHDLIRTPDFSGLPGLEKLILEDCIHLVQIHESIGDLHSLLILNLRNCKSLVELPEEMSSLNSLKELVLDGCSNLDGLDMELEHHKRRRLFLQKDGIVASTSHITAPSLKLFFCSRFLSRKNSRLASFSLPCSLVALHLDGSSICSLPESIKSLSALNFVTLTGCKMLQTLPELPSNLRLIDVSGCHSLERVANILVDTFIQVDCHQLDQVQDLIELELIQKFDLHMFRMMGVVFSQLQPWMFQMLLEDNISSILLHNGSEPLTFYQEEEEWLIQNECPEYFTFKISSPADEPPAHGLQLLTRFSATSESKCEQKYLICVEIRNVTKGRSRVCFPGFIPMKEYQGTYEMSWLSHWKCGGDGLEFDDGDEVRVSVDTYDPSIDIKMVGVRLFYDEQEEARNNNPHSSSSYWDDQVLSDEHVAKAEIASLIFRYYYCESRYLYDKRGYYGCNFYIKFYEASEP